MKHIRLGRVDKVLRPTCVMRQGREKLRNRKPTQGRLGPAGRSTDRRGVKNEALPCREEGSIWNEMTFHENSIGLSKRKVA